QDADDQERQRRVHALVEKPGQGERHEQRGHPAGEAGGAEHGRGLARLLQLVPRFHLGELNLLTEQPAHVTGQVAEEFTQRLVGLQRANGVIRIGHCRVVAHGALNLPPSGCGGGSSDTASYGKPPSMGRRGAYNDHPLGVDGWLLIAPARTRRPTAKPAAAAPNRKAIGRLRANAVTSVAKAFGPRSWTLCEYRRTRCSRSVTTSLTPPPSSRRPSLRAVNCRENVCR